MRRISAVSRLHWVPAQRSAGRDLGRRGLPSGILRVRGSKTEAANREVPLIPAAKALLERLDAGRQKAATDAVDGVASVGDPRGKVLRVGEQGSPSRGHARNSVSNF